MKHPKNKSLIEQIEVLRTRLEEAEQTIEAIRNGDIDALIDNKGNNIRIFTIEGAETAYRLMVDTMSEGAMTLDPNGSILYANKRISEMLVIPHQQIISKPIYRFIKHSEHNSIKSLISETVNGERTYCDVTFVGLNSKPFPAYVSSAPLFLGETTNICLVITDLTERKLAEKNLINLNTERQLKWQLKSVLEHIKDAVMVFSQDGKLLDANAAARETWELSENLYGKGYEEIHSRFRYYDLNKCELPIHLQPVSLALSGQEYKDLELCIIDPNKHIEQYLSYSAAHVHDEKGITRFIVVSIHDITGKKKNEIELRQAKLLAEQKAAEFASVNKELEAFSYSVSHDLRTPIQLIIGFSRILCEDYSEVLDAEGKAIVIRIINSGQRMNELIDDMLSLSRVSRQEIQRTKIDLSKLAEDFISELMEANPERKIVISIQPSMIISGDEKLIKMALQNLLRNSWKFSSKTPDARIEMGSFIKNNKSIFFVKDNGAGFDMKFSEKLFEPFKRLHSDNEFPGTGIGLAIVERVIKRHGGRIWAHGSPGKGATFFFTLSQEYQI